MLDIVKVGEFSPVIGGRVLLELSHGLPTKGVSINQEKNPSGIGKLDQSINEVDCHEGLSTSGAHLGGRVAGWGSRCLGNGAYDFLAGV